MLSYSYKGDLFRKTWTFVCLLTTATSVMCKLNTEEPAFSWQVTVHNLFSHCSPYKLSAVCHVGYCIKRKHTFSSWQLPQRPLEKSPKNVLLTDSFFHNRAVFAVTKRLACMQISPSSKSPGMRAQGYSEQIVPKTNQLCSFQHTRHPSFSCIQAHWHHFNLPCLYTVSKMCIFHF